MKYKEEYRQYLSEKSNLISKATVVGHSGFVNSIISKVLSDIEQINEMEAGPLFDLLYEKLHKMDEGKIGVLPYHQFAANKREEELKKLGI